MVVFDNSFARLGQPFFTRTSPAQVPAPALLQINHRLCRELELDPRWLGSVDGIAMLGGNKLPPTADPLSMVYAGHQFGGFSPQLGDGRVILLGEILGRHRIRWDLQLKGAGSTPYSRGGDGKATLSAALREYLLSEALFSLGVPTTRALAVVRTGETIERETNQPGAVLARAAHSHIRVGTFQYFSAQRDQASLRALANYTIKHHFPLAADTVNPTFSLLESIVERQAHLVARWMHLGFIHGVMNTDNMQIVGETIDYGPCAFMDDFHPKRVFSSVDTGGRYAWNRQPAMAKWNLGRLAESLLAILSPDLQTALHLAETAVEAFDGTYNSAFVAGFKRKLGLLANDISDTGFVDSTMKALAKDSVDFTLFFRRLTQVADGADASYLLSLFANASRGRAWLRAWRKRIQKEPQASPSSRAAIMRGVNPIFIARNHRVEEAIAHALQGEFAIFHRLATILESPYEEQPENSAYEAAPLDSEKVLETFCNT